METAETTVQVKVNAQGLDEAITKAAKLKELINEAKSLVDDLASNPVCIKLEIDV